MTTTRVSRHIKAPRERVYRALVDPLAIAKWKVPDGMRCQVHAFDARESGTFRISLTYQTTHGAGKTTAHTDTYHGCFVELVPNERVVELDEFETNDPAFAGEMRITITLAEEDSGTELVATHENVPPGVSPEDNELGWRMALAKLAALLENG